MKRVLMILSLLLAINVAASAQSFHTASITGTTCPGEGCVNLDVGGSGSFGIQISGSFSGTVQFEQTLNGTTFVAWKVYPNADTSQTQVTSATAAGLWVGSTVGVRQVRIRFSSFSSGSAVVSTIGSSARVQSGGGGGNGDISNLVFDVTEHGVTCDGTDHSVELLTLLADVNTAGGGTVFFPACTSTYRFDSQILIPSTATAPGDWGYPRPRQANIRITGAAGGKLWYNPDFIPGTAAVRLDLRYQSTEGRAKIESYGLGTLMVDHLTLVDLGTGNRTPFIHSNNTTLLVRENTFIGTNQQFGTSDGATTNAAGYAIGTTTITLASAGTGTFIVDDLIRFTTVDGVYRVTSGDANVANGGTITFTPALTEAIPASATEITQVAQDAIVLGGASEVFDANPEQTFQGYGTEIVANHFRGINRGVYGLNSANGVMFTRNTFQGNVRNGVAIEFYGSNSPGFFIYGLNITDNLIEMDTYRYGVRMTDARETSFIGNQFHDPDSSVTVSMFRFDRLAVKNTIVCGTMSDLFGIPLMSGNYAQYNAVLCPAVTNALGGFGTQSLQMPYGLLVRGVYDSAKAYPGQLIIADQNNVDAHHLSIGYDYSNSRGDIDAAFSTFGRTLRINKLNGGDVYAAALGFTTGMAWKDDAPTISSACSNPTLTWYNGTAIFQIDVGTSCTGRSTVTVTLPTVTNKYRCDADNLTSPSTRVVRGTAWTTGTVTLTNFDWAGAAQDWADGTDLLITCTAG